VLIFGGLIFFTILLGFILQSEARVVAKGFCPFWHCDWIDWYSEMVEQVEQSFHF
jgi:hypothetical protein